MSEPRKDNAVILRLFESPATARQLEQEGIVSHNYFSRMKKRLIELGLIGEKIDGRSKQIFLTAKGEKLAKKINGMFEVENER